MVAYTGASPSFYDRVFLISELESLPAYAGLAGPLPKTQSDGPPISRADLSNEALSRLMEFYAEDYRTWGSHLAAA
jgi:hypothetical protein